MIQRPLHFSTLIFLAALVLSACTPPRPSGDLNNSGSDSFSLESETTGDAVLGNQAESVSENGANPERKTMKTLADFEQIEATQAIFKTNKGEIVMDLYTEKAPLTTTNFLNLIKEGFYDGIVFHRIIPDFMAQVGDPLTKEPGMEGRWGTGNPGYSIADEFDPSLKHDSEGILSMANSGPNTGGSQIFITYEATPWLDGKHAVFGKVVEGMDVLRTLEIGDKIIAATYR